MSLNGGQVDIIRFQFMHLNLIFKAFYSVLVWGVLSITGLPAHAQSMPVVARDYVAYDRVEATWSGRRYRQQIWAAIGANIEAVSPTEDRYSFASSAAFVKSKSGEMLALGDADGSAYAWLRNRSTGEVRGESAETWLSAEANHLLRSLNPLVLVNGVADWETELPVFDGRLKGFGRNPVAHFHVERIDAKAEKYLVTYHMQGLAFRDATIRSGLADIFGFGIFDHHRGLSEGFGVRYSVRVVDANGHESVVKGEKLAKRRDSDLLLSQLRDAEALAPARLLFSPGFGENVWVSGREEEQGPPWLHSVTQIVGLADNFALLAGEKQTNTVWLAAMGTMRAFDQFQMNLINGAATAVEKINTETQNTLYTQDSMTASWIAEMKAYDGVSGMIQQKSNEFMGAASAELFGDRISGEIISETLGTVVSTGLDSLNFLGGLRKIEQGIGMAAGAKVEKLLGQNIAGNLGGKLDQFAGKAYDKSPVDLQILADNVYDIALNRRMAVEAMQGSSKGWFDKLSLANLANLPLRFFKGDDDPSTMQVSESPSIGRYINNADPAEIQQYAEAFNVRPLDYGPLPDWLSQRLYPDWRTLPFVKQLLERIALQSAGGNTQPPTVTPPAVPSLSNYLIPLGSISFASSFWADFDAAHSLTSAWSAGDIGHVQLGWQNNWWTNFVPQGGTSLAGGMYWGTMQEAGQPNHIYAVGFGPLPTAAPTTGSATYTWVGGTAPMDNYGRTGSVTHPGSLSVNFATGQFTYGGLAYSIAGINYQFGQASFLPGSLGLSPVNVSGSLSCSACSGYVSGRLLGTGGTGAAISAAVLGYIDNPPINGQTIGTSTVQMYAR